MRKLSHPTLLRAAPKTRSNLIDKLVSRKKPSEAVDTAEPKQRNAWKLTKRARTLG